MANELDARIALLASDRESGASEILDEAINLLRDTIAAGVPVLPIAKGICRAQPSMASMWNVALEVLAADHPAERLDTFALRVARAPEALARVASDYFLVDAPGGLPFDVAQGTPSANRGVKASGYQTAPLRLVTISFSRSVVTIIERIAASRPLRVSCSESRPALEGRRLASRLAAAGVAVTFFSDAAIGQALGGADAVLLGADAVAPEWFLNKSGTRMLAAAAQHQGVPVHVVATRDKFVSHAVGARLAMREGAAADIWEAPPAGVTVRNPYFESIPLELVATLITEMGVLGAGLAADVCESISRDQPPDLIDKLL